LKSLGAILVGIKTYNDFQNYKLEILIRVVEEAKRIGVTKGFEYEKYDGVFGLRKYKIKNTPDNFDVHCNIFMSEDSVEVKDGDVTIWNYTEGWVFDKKWIALNRLKHFND